MCKALETLAAPPKRFWQQTWVELLVVVTIAAVLCLLLIPDVQWVADGNRELPVQVFVFDIESGELIRVAEVVIMKALGLYEIEKSAEIAQQFERLTDYAKSMSAEQKGKTDEHGLTTCQFVFNSGSGNKHPKTRVFPRTCWIYVSSDGFRGVVISLGAADVEYDEVKRNGGFLVPIGIMRDYASTK